MMSDIERWVGTKVDDDRLDESRSIVHHDDSNARRCTMPIQPPLKGPVRGFRHGVVVMGRDGEKSRMTTTRHVLILTDLLVQLNGKLAEAHIMGRVVRW